MKKILILTAFVPSKLSAAENYTRQLINDLSRDNLIDLIYFKYKKDDNYHIKSKNIRVLEVFKNSRFIKLMNVFLFPFLFPIFTVRFNVINLIKLLKYVREEKYDLVFYDHSQVLLFSKFIKKVPSILMLHDVESQRYSRILNPILANWCKKSEFWILKNKSNIFTFSYKDKQLIEEMFNIQSNVTNFFIDENINNKTPELVSNYYVLFARWSRKDNLNGLLWFVDNVMPYLNSNIYIKLIGAELPDRVLEILKSYTNVEVLGFVDDPYQIISNAKALISPIFTGAGVKVKVIDSLACGTFVIGTEISFEGIYDEYLDYTVNVNSSDDFIKSINEFNVNIECKIELKNKFKLLYDKNSIKSYIINEMYINQ